MRALEQIGNLAAIREQLGMTQTEFARAVRISRQYLSKVENSDGHVSPKLSRRIADLCQSRGLPVSNGFSPAFRMVPVRSWAQAGIGFDFDELPLDWQRRIPTDCPDDRAFAVEIQGDSMEPKYTHGDIAVVMPSKQPRAGDLVVARLDAEGVIFKVFTSRSEGNKRQSVFSSYNQVYQPVTVSDSAIRWSFPVYQIIRQVWR